MRLEKVGRIIIYALGTSPLWIVPWLLYPANYGKMPFLLSAIFIIAVLMVLAVGKAEPLGRPGKLLLLAFWLYLAAYLLATVFGIDHHRSFWGEQSRQSGFVVLVHFVLLAVSLRYFLRLPRHWIILERVVVWTAVLAGGAAVLEALSPQVATAFGQSFRYAGWLDNPAFLGAYMVLAAFTALRLIAKVGRNERYLTAAAVIVCLGGILASGSRGASVALVGGGIVFGIVYLLWQRQKKIALALTAVLIAAAALLLLAPKLQLVQVLPSPVWRIVNVSNYFGYENTPRMISWGMAWQGFLARPLTGWGPENFEYVFDRYYDPALLRFSFYETVSDKPHSLPLEILVTGGVLMSLAFIFLFASAVVLTFRLKNQGRLKPVEAAAILGLITAYLVSGSFLFEIPLTLLLLFITFGYLLSLAFAGEQPRERVPVPATAAATKRLIKVVGLLVLLGLNVYAVGFAAAASQAAARALDSGPAQTDVWERQANRAVWWPSPQQDELRELLAIEFIRREGASFWPANFVRSEIKPLSQALADSYGNNKENFTNAFYYAQLLAIEGEYAVSPEKLNEAVETLYQAYQISPKRQVVPLQLAKVLMLGDKATEAVDLLRELVGENPTLAEPHWFLALALNAVGQAEDSADELVKSFSLGRFPKDLPETNYVISVLASVERYEEIIPLYQRLIAEQPDKPDWHANLAATYEKAGKPSLAILEAQKAAELDPSFAAEAEEFINRIKAESQPE